MCEGSGAVISSRLPLRNGKRLDITAPLPSHMKASFETLGFNPNQYDAQDTDPEDDA